MLLFCTSADPPVAGASGIAADLISQLLIFVMVFFRSSKACVPGTTRLASACSRAYLLASARFAEVSPPFVAAYALSASLYFFPHALLLPPLARSRLSAVGFTLYESPVFSFDTYARIRKLSPFNSSL